MTASIAASAVIQMQELCDYIADFLHESSWDLRTCALVSPTLTSAAQRHLFHDVIFNRGCLDIDDVSNLGGYDEAGACRRFCSVLKTSPHLIPLVRRLRTSFEHAVLSQLGEIEFPNVRAVVLHRRSGGPTDDASLTLAAHLIGSPSLHRVGLYSPMFHSIGDVGRLFQNCTPALNSIVLHHVSVDERRPASESDARNTCLKIRTLRWKTLFDQEPDWLLDPQCPFDLSGLTDFEYGATLTPAILKLLRSSRLSLRRLRIDAQYAVNSDYTDDAQVALLAQFPALTHLTIASTGKQLRDVETLLAGLLPANRIASLTIELMKVRQLQADAMRQLGATCASMSCTVVVHVRRTASGADGAGLASLVRSAFAEVLGRGKLQVTVR
ncbi:hypothetical protein B0H10DRAFT_2450723 [Mycena sp. CBHHK59/15]|nr:hypothetical protein B0H10DRAFT_2450723 [Mycena sp. CBHHK59/15]